MTVRRKILKTAEKSTLAYSSIMTVLSAYREISGKTPRVIMYFKDLDVAYIAISKAGNSTISKTFLRHYGLDKNLKSYHEIHIVKKKFRINTKELKKKQCFKFAFVRNPFDRLVSCYQNKVVDEYYPLQKRYFGIIKRNQSFDDFVRGVCKIPDTLSDFHFRSQYSILYDRGEPLVNYVGKLENFEKDFEPIKKKYKLKVVKKVNVSKKRRDYKKYYTPELAKMVYERYKQDVEVFGYEKEYQKLLKG